MAEERQETGKKKGNEKGIEHITKIFSFIILIYLCNSMLLVSYIQNYTINNENIFITILYLFSIFISSLLIIPIVSFTYVELNKYKIYYKTKSSNIIDGQRSLKL